MKPLGGPHHFTGVTADVQTNVDFWCRVMGLRFVKNTLNYETTFRYHTYFGDEDGSPGSVITFLHGVTGPAAVRTLIPYVDADERARVERHLAGCDACTAYIDQMRVTIAVVGRVDVDDIPDAMKVELMHAFRDWAPS